MKKYFIVIVLLISGYHVTAQQQAVPFTLEDRELLIRIAATLDSLRIEMNCLGNEMKGRCDEMIANFDAIDARFDAIDARFDVILKKFDYVIWMLCLIIALQLVTIGYMIWNRLITVAKIKNDIDELKRINEKMKAIFIKQSVSQPGVLQILKNAGIL